MPYWNQTNAEVLNQLGTFIQYAYQFVHELYVQLQFILMNEDESFW